jgi:hypothetical protein
LNSGNVEDLTQAEYELSWEEGEPPYNVILNRVDMVTSVVEIPVEYYKFIKLIKAALPDGLLFDGTEVPGSTVRVTFSERMKKLLGTLELFDCADIDMSGGINYSTMIWPANSDGTWSTVQSWAAEPASSNIEEHRKYNRCKALNIILHRVMDSFFQGEVNRIYNANIESIGHRDRYRAVQLTMQKIYKKYHGKNLVTVTEVRYILDSWHFNQTKDPTTQFEIFDKIDTECASLDINDKLNVTLLRLYQMLQASSL